MAAGTSPRLRLLHMRDEIESLSQELAGVGFETYRESYALRRITERAIQIVSEAARALPEELRARSPDATWADIINKVLWETATADLPKLQPIIQRMLAEFQS